MSESIKIKTIPIAKPYFGEEEIAAVRRPLESGWVTQGPEVAQFEKEFAAYVDSPYACAVSSCTAALHLALTVAGVGPGHEVITVSHSFIATANSIRYCGAMPVFVDIDSGTFNICPSQVEAAITERTRAILCVHQMGMPCDLKALVAIARRHSLPLIEDAACAVGSEILWQEKWERIGKPHGDIACFSFHPRKIISTGDGGMMTTSNEQWAQLFRLRRQHGMSVPDAERHLSNQVVFESYEGLGYNYRMTDIQAAVGREQLKKLPEIFATRRLLAARYQKILGSIEGLRCPQEPEWARSNWQSYCIRLPQHWDQREVMQQMLDRGVSTRRAIMCTHREPAYSLSSSPSWRCVNSCRGGSCTHLKESEIAQDTCILLPLHPRMTEEEQGRVVEALCEAGKVKR